MWGQFVDGFIAIIRVFYNATAYVGIANFGVAIILLTIVIKILLYPLTVKQLSSVKAMQELQPQIKELQEKHRKNPEKSQKAVMELYREKKVNPLAGCLPLLVQMPILIAFYQALYKLPTFASQMDLPPNALKFLWIADITQKDLPITIGGVSLIVSVLALLVAAATFWQQKVSTASPNDPTQRTMLYTMPLFIGYISLKMPAGLAIYWVMFSTMGALQQIYINKKKKPVTTEEESPATPPEKKVNLKKGAKDKK